MIIRRVILAAMMTGTLFAQETPAPPTPTPTPAATPSPTPVPPPLTTRQLINGLKDEEVEAALKY